ncbi:MAG: hypothetical protein ACRDK7_10875 [Solirubrobacteraceae bacterium]
MSALIDTLRQRPTAPLHRGIVDLGLVLVIAGLAAGTASPAGARANTAAAITPSLSPNRLGARGALVFTIHYGGGEFGVPSPVRRAVLRFPAGLNLEDPDLRSCATARLRVHGARGCPARAEIGHGYAIAQARAGSQIVTEDIRLWIFLGPLESSGPTFEILGQGYTPFEERLVLTGTGISDSPPYGEDMVLRIPPIPTLPLESDASIVTLSLTIGVSKPRHPRDANTVAVPPGCPPGGFPFAGEFTYADGSTGSALATSPCP